MLFFNYTGIECQMLSNPSNGTVNIDVAMNGDTTASYSCDEGFDLNGVTTRTCQQNEQWSEVEPTCQSESSVVW